MAVPDKVRVKVMSDAAGYIEMTHVAHREAPFSEVLDLVVAVAGLDLARILTLLKAGTAVVNGYRYRWPGLVLEEIELAPLLERFPRPKPDRPFDAQRCLLAKIRAGVETIELPRESAGRRRLTQKENFWDVLMELAMQRQPAYESYSYRDGADIYSFQPDSQDTQTLRRAAPLLAVQRTAEQVTGLPLDKVVLYVKR